MKKLYKCTDVEKFIDNYIEKGGTAINYKDGVLTSGDWVLFDEKGKLKTFVISEVFINEWNSAQSIRGYQVTPKKISKNN